MLAASLTGVRNRRCFSIVEKIVKIGSKERGIVFYILINNLFRWSQVNSQSQCFLKLHYPSHQSVEVLRRLFYHLLSFPIMFRDLERYFREQFR